MWLDSSFSFIREMAIGSTAISSAVISSEANKGYEAEAGANGARRVWLITRC